MTSHAQKEGGKRVPLLSRTSTESFVFSDEPLVSCVQHALLVLLLDDRVRVTTSQIDLTSPLCKGR